MTTPSPSSPAQHETMVRGSATWLPPGSPTVTVSGYPITGGLVYLGSGVPAAYAAMDEPALIDPEAPVRRIRLDQETPPEDQRPSYLDLSPGARAAYLEWLAVGRTGPTQGAHLWLFLYGLERRVLIDLAGTVGSQQEYKAIADEVAAVAERYPNATAFEVKAAEFTDLLDTLIGLNDPALRPPPPGPRTGELPMRLRLGIGRYVARGLPIPAGWAYSWHAYSPQRRWGPEATRRPDDFRRAFEARYAEAYPSGGITAALPEEPLLLEYHPTSPGFADRPVRLHTQLPDVRGLTEPLEALAEIATVAETDLAASSPAAPPQAKPAFAWPPVPDELLDDTEPAPVRPPAEPAMSGPAEPPTEPTAPAPAEPPTPGPGEPPAGPVTPGPAEPPVSGPAVPTTEPPTPGPAVAPTEPSASDPVLPLPEWGTSGAPDAEPPASGPGTGSPPPSGGAQAFAPPPDAAQPYPPPSDPGQPYPPPSDPGHPYAPPADPGQPYAPPAGAAHPYPPRSDAARSEAYRIPAPATQPYVPPGATPEPEAVAQATAYVGARVRPYVHTVSAPPVRPYVQQVDPPRPWPDGEPNPGDYPRSPREPWIQPAAPPGASTTAQAPVTGTEPEAVRMETPAAGPAAAQVRPGPACPGVEAPQPADPRPAPGTQPGGGAAAGGERSTSDARPHLAAAETLLRLIALTGIADGYVRAVRRHVVATLALSATERQGLDDRLERFVHQRPAPAVVRKRFEALPTEQQRRIMDLLIAAAGAEGVLEPGHAAVLTAVFDMLGCDEGALQRRLGDLEVAAVVDESSVDTTVLDDEVIRHTLAEALATADLVDALLSPVPRYAPCP